MPQIMGNLLIMFFAARMVQIHLENNLNDLNVRDYMCGCNI